MKKKSDMEELGKKIAAAVTAKGLEKPKTVERQNPDLAIQALVLFK